MAPIRPKPPLSILPLGMLLRNFLTSTVTSSPFLIAPSIALLSRLADSKSALLSPDRNPVLRLALKKTVYGQFCAGENSAEVARTVERLKKLGYTGVMLSYGKEVVLRKDEMASGAGDTAEAESLAQIETWKEGNLETVRIAQAGDFVAIKFTGAGRNVFFELSNRSPPPGPLAQAMDEICSLAVSRGVKLLIDAEQAAIQHGIDDWSLAYTRKYNTAPGHPTVFCTYQSYLKQAPQTLKSHLGLAKKEGLTLGVKLVRGAYLATEPRHLIHDTKVDTDNAFDDLASSLLMCQWSKILPGYGPFPCISLILATHNASSVEKARRIVKSGKARAPVAFGQLQGMADEVSCSLMGPEPGGTSYDYDAKVDGTVGLGAYKYVAWGSTADCMKYLVRRAEENRDAVGRTKDSRDAMWKELVRRFQEAIGLS